MWLESEPMETRLKQELERQGKTAYWLAGEMKVTVTTAYNWTNGRNKPRTNQMVKLSKLLQVSVEELFFSDNGGSKE